MSLRLKLFLPLIFAGVLLLVYAVTSGPQLTGPDGLYLPALLLAGLAALLLAAAARVESLVLRPLARLKQTVDALPGAERSRAGMAPGDAGVHAIEAGVARLGEVSREAEERLARERAERERLEQELRGVRERYELAVERANDGLWEWDLRSGRIEFSPRWKGMMGYLDASVARMEDWKQLVHPDDHEAVLMRLQNHLNASTPFFEAEYRVRHRDGAFRWVHSRGMAIRHASGKAYRLVMMDKDIHPRKELELALIHAAEGLSSVSGRDFFRALARSLSELLGTRDNLVAHCLDDPPTRVRTLAYYSGGRFWDDFEFDLCGTSCGAVLGRGEIVYCPTGVCEIWPEEKQYDRDSYIGVPMFDSAGRIIGHFACMDAKPMAHDLPHLAIFKIFSVRAGTELERTLLREKLSLLAGGESTR